MPRFAKPATPARPSTARPSDVVIYSANLDKQREAAARSAADAREMMEFVVAGVEITTQKQYTEIEDIVRGLAREVKEIEDERKSLVQPLNDEVNIVNEWYREPRELRKKARELLEKAMGAFLIKQRQEQQKLKDEAAAEAKKLLEEKRTHAPAAAVEKRTESVHALVQASAEAAPAIAKGFTPKEEWLFEIKDERLLPDEFLIKVPNLKALEAHIAVHGDKNVPPGVEVKPNVRFTVRS